MKEIGTLQYITQDHPEKTHSALTEEACQAGVSWIQLRVKGRSFMDWIGIARSVKWVCERYGAKLIINDSPFIAKEIRAHGVHLGQKDMDPEEARRILGPDAIIGGTANTLEEAIKLSKKWVDYIGLGPLRFTTTKRDLSPVLGLEGARTIIAGLREHRIDVPVIVIGGVNPTDMPELRMIGAHGAAVSAAITNAPDRTSIVKEFLTL